VPQPWETEITELHAFFEAWYRGEVQNTDDVFSRVAGALAPEFTLITSGGRSVNRAQLLAMLRSQHGTIPDLKMLVQSTECKLATDDIVLTTYEEHGTTGGRTKATLITAVLRRHPEQRDRLEWVHIHEVQLPAGA
jgi:hypothetical protein